MLFVPDDCLRVRQVGHQDDHRSPLDAEFMGAITYIAEIYLSFLHSFDNFQPVRIFIQFHMDIFLFKSPSSDCRNNGAEAPVIGHIGHAQCFRLMLMI